MEILVNNQLNVSVAQEEDHKELITYCPTL